MTAKPSLGVAFYAQQDAAREMLKVLKAAVAMIEDSLDGAIGYGRDTAFVAGVSDVELTPDGSVLLSHARAAIANAEAAGITERRT